MRITVPSPLDAVIELQGSELPPDALVLTYRVHEALSAPYLAIVEFSTSQQFSLETAIGTSFILILPNPAGAGRIIRGDVWDAALVRTVGQKLHFSLTLKPKLAWLGARENTRIYQQLSVPDILAEVLEEASLTASSDLNLSQTYAPREFVVQYRESTLNFVQRLCEEVGIFYYFVHKDEETRLVFADDISKLSDPPAPIPMSLGSTIAATIPLASLDRQLSLRTSTVQLRDFDVENPVVFPEGEATAGSPFPQPYFRYPGRFTKSDEGKLLAESLLRSLRHDADQYYGSCDVAGPVLTGTAEIVGAAEADVAGVIRFVEIHTHGVQHAEQPEKYAVHVDFVAVPDDVPYLPARRGRRPKVLGVQTAVVVGEDAQDQALCVDPLGRIKVHFHWDRLNPANDTASTWIRVSQVALGGSMILPRVGWEVAVSFLDGDPDQPVVIGRVYNAENAPPLALPANKASGAISSSSSPGGAGKNEISIGDSGGNQGFSVKAQKDFNFTTGYDQVEDIKNNDDSQVNLNLTRSVTVDDSVTIGANQTITYGAHQKCTIKGNQTISVGGNETANATANQLNKVTGDRSITVGGNQMMLCNGERRDVMGNVECSIGALDLLATASNLSENIAGTSSSSAGAVRVHLTGGDHGEVVTGAKSVTVAGAVAAIVKGSMNASCEGAVARVVGGIVQRKIKGSLTIKAPMVTMAGATGTFKAGGTQLKMSGGPIQMK
jgi:type VI secretion system secreted protein VgrG